MALAALLLWLGWTAWALSGSALQQRWLAPIELTPELGAWRMAVGAGEVTERGFTITWPGPLGNAIVAIELPDALEAARFSRVEVHAVERLPGSLTLGWSTSQTFRQTSTQIIQRLDEATGITVLDGNRHWKDDIYFLSIEQMGFTSGPWTLQSLTLHQELREFSQLQRLLWSSLFPADPWAQRNPHFIWPLNAPLPISPVAALAIWALLSVLLMWLMGVGRAKQRLVWLLMPMLIGWLLLDLRWQVELAYKARDTYRTFAELSAEERFGNDLDGHLFEFLQRLRSAHERSEFERVFAFSEFEFLRKRARYHLATWAVRESPVSALTPGLSAQLRPGDLVLLLDAPEVLVDIDEDVVRITSLDGEPLFTGQLLKHQREWLALIVLQPR